MSLSTSRLSYDDAFEFFERALTDPKGVRACFGQDEGAATHYRMRCHVARNIDRQENEKIYDKGAPLHGRSVYDVLTLRVVQDDDLGEWWVYATRNVAPAVIESLSELEEIEYTEVKQLEDKSNVS